MSACSKCGNWHNTMEPCPPYKVGDRVELVKMDDDPDPVRAGVKGTVLACDRVQMGPRPYWQVAVKWDDGRTLSTCCPPDVIQRVP